MKLLVAIFAILAIAYAEESVKEKRGILSGIGYGGYGGYSGYGGYGLGHGLAYSAPVVSAPVVSAPIVSSVGLGHGIGGFGHGIGGLGLGHGVGLGYGGYSPLLTKAVAAPIITKTITPVVSAPLIAKTYAAPISVGYGYSSLGAHGW